MKITFPILIIVLAVLGCGRFGASLEPSNGSAANSNSATSTVPKAVDIPSLIDKSPEEINKIVGQQQKLEQDAVKYKLPLGNLDVRYNNDKQVMISYEFEHQIVDGHSLSGFPTAQKLGEHVGLAIQGTPSSSTYEDKYYDYVVGGKKCELTVGKLLDAYNSVKLYCP